MTKRSGWLWLGAVLAAAAALRFYAAGYGLPAVFNADEPHVVDVAVSFGAGSLRPHFFKYPTLWPYLLFGVYGIYFVLWSGFGFLHTIRQFGELFAWDPTSFYLIARLLSTTVSLAALERVYRTGRLLGGGLTGLWAAALLAASPPLVIAAHAAKPDSLMFLLSAWAWWFAARHWESGRERDLVLCGLAAGLAASSQYTALPLVVLVPAAAWAKGGLCGAWRGLAAVAGGFLAGSPYILLDWRAFAAAVADMSRFESLMPHEPAMGLRVLRNILAFSGGWIPGALALVAGAALLIRAERRKAALLLLPVAAYAAILSISADGAWARYLFAVYPALAFVAAVGVEAGMGPLARGMDAPPKAAVALVLLFLALPGARGSISFVREAALPDTRTLAAAWFASEVPSGTCVLLDQEHASPRLFPDMETVAEMLRVTEASGHPRRRYYELLRSGHPGGGYRLRRVPRQPLDLHVWPGHAALSAQGHPIVDVRPGLAAARAAGIEIIVLTSFGADPVRSPELAKFLAQTESQGRLMAQFEPDPGVRTGPRIRVYRVNSPSRHDVSSK